MNTYPDVKKQLDIYLAYDHLISIRARISYETWKLFANDYLTPAQIELYKTVAMDGLTLQPIPFGSQNMMPILKGITVNKIKNENCFDLTPTELIFLNTRGIQPNKPKHKVPEGTMERTDKEVPLLYVGGRKSRRKRKASRQVKKIRRSRKFVPK